MRQQLNALDSLQTVGMSNPRPRTRDAISRNLKMLMAHADYSQRDLAAKSGVSQRQISNILSGATSCSIEVADALGKAFNLNGWQLMIHDLPEALVDSPSISRLVDSYIHASAAARLYMDEIAAREKIRK